MDISNSEDLLLEEAYSIGKYFFKDYKMTTAIANQYVSLHRYRQILLSKKEQSLLNLCIKYPFLFSYVDSGLKYAKPKSALSQKLFCMAAILETTPENFDKFLLDKQMPFIIAVLNFILDGFWAVCKVIAGYIFVKTYFLDIKIKK